ncbi:FadR/GntR family transcriptional regulator [Hoeflea sp. YIM 152468]|uniref:FadR/GntR family transcriptional regulator n=1 Tax=Hoeflea sp. YIM 152468 TaxID=3031759 RepID=UPI0023DC67B3|nr:FadR/GntR family transcriptional regulator [Hoeflea sp. YIM 152468]MDF1609064.1 FadR/GntR family transcriptional regulator [Hoeflea sp. YIM 152468]
MTENALGKPSRVSELAAVLRGKIRRGEYRPGDKLPTEALLSLEFGVSRTVLREAVAALRADGLLLSRQGSGVFVQEPPNSKYPPLRDLDQTRLSSVLELLELRLAIEGEAAALAALRCNPEQEETMLSALRLVRTEIESGRMAAKADFALHMAIAAASGNPRFGEMLAMFGPDSIPRTMIGAQMTRDPSYLATLDAEHTAIVQAIQDHDPEAARRAMREHLGHSQRRYRALQMT